MTASDFPAWLRVRPIQQWPRELTENRVRSPFSAAWSSTADQLRAELRHLGTRTEPAAMVMQIAITDDDLRLDGGLRAGRAPTHPGVILEITSRHGVLSYPCDTYDRWRDNVRAIVLTLEKLRAIDRYGVTASGQQYTGWAQLPAGGSVLAPLLIECGDSFVGAIAGVQFDETSQLRIKDNRSAWAQRLPTPDGMVDLDETYVSTEPPTDDGGDE